MFGGEDWFQTLSGWFPQNLGSSGSNSPNQQVVDMAYSTRGSVTFDNVVVPSSGLYTIAWRYAFQGGLFPSVNNRQMGVAVNGTRHHDHRTLPDHRQLRRLPELHAAGSPERGPRLRHLVRGH